MSEQISIRLNGTQSTSGNQILIPLNQYSSNVNGAQDVTFVDGGNFTASIQRPGGSGSGSGSGAAPPQIAELAISKVGKNDDAADKFRFGLSGFNENFDVSIKSEGHEDSFIISGHSSFSTNGNIYTINYRGSDGRNYRVRLDPGDAFVTFVCFTPGTKIKTPDGPVDVSTLKPGDLVMTKDHGPQPVLHILTSDARFNADSNSHKPIRFAKGSLGEGTPRQTLIVSPNHRVLIKGALCQRLFNCREVLAPAKGLTGLRGVHVQRKIASTQYIALVMSHHQLIQANGHWCESLLVTPYSIAHLPRSQLDGIDLTSLEEAHMRPARKLLTTQQSRQLVRAARNTVHAPGIY
jgi:hypothetical protein